MSVLKDHKYFVILLLALFIISVVGLDAIPPLWWDEGWTLNVARNWVDYGHYGQFNSNQPESPGLSAFITIVAPAALSFKIFGVGPLQGRLPFILISFMSLGVIYWLGKKLYNTRLSKASVIILLLISPVNVGPLLMGRQVLAEIPAVFLLLLGFVTIFMAFQSKRAWFAVASGIIWGICMVSKAQIWPFLLFSLLSILLFTLVLKWKRLTLLILIASGTALVSWRLILFLYSTWLAHQGGQTAMALDLYSVTAVVLDSTARKMALKYLLSYGALSLAGTLMACWICYKEYPTLSDDRAPMYLVRLGLTAFTASWLAWYLLLGIYYARYLVVPVFASSLFTGDLFSRLTNDFDLRGTIRRTSDFLLRRKVSIENGRALFAVILVDIALVLNALFLVILIYYSSGDRFTPITRVTDYLNSHTPTDALIETYDSELFFLLDRSYHYPPNDLHVSYVKKVHLNQDIPIDYDPLAATPDYLVLGGFSKAWQVYDQVIAEGKFKLIQSFPGYDVYERNY